MPKIVAPSHVAKPPRGTTPDELVEYRDLLTSAEGALVSDGEEYETKADAISKAGSIIRGLRWLGFDGKVRARYGVTTEGKATFALRISETDDEAED